HPDPLAIDSSHSTAEEDSSTVKFDFISKSRLRDFFKNNFDGYEAKLEAREKNDEILFQQIDSILGILPNSQRTFMRDIRTQIKAYAQQAGLTGGAAQEASDVSHILVRDAKGEVRRVLDDRLSLVVSYDKWNQPDYLLFCLQFFMHSYLELIKKKEVKAK